MKTFFLLDIQSTGLFWRTSRITYIGTAFLENDTWKQKEWYLSSEEEEPLALEELFSFLQPYAYFYTYNGTGFDLPYLEHKYHAYGLESPFLKKEHRDLLRLLSPYKKILKLLSMKQKDLEFFLGYETPAENEKPLQRDLLGMIAIFPMLSYCSLEEGNLKIQQSKLLEDSKRELQLTAVLPIYLPKPISYYEAPYYLWCEKNILKLKVTLYEGSLKFFFPNYKDYYYLPLEDTAIHKSIGAYVDKAHRINAKAATAYQKKEGVFLPVCFDVTAPLFYEEYRNHTPYLLFEEESIQLTTNENQVYWQYYLKMVLKMLCSS